MPVLYESAAGGEVVTLQERLQDIGFNPGRVDGHFGPATKAAVLAFQHSAGLVADGVAGPRTLSALGLVSDARLPEEQVVLKNTLPSQASQPGPCSQSAWHRPPPAVEPVQLFDQAAMSSGYPSGSLGHGRATLWSKNERVVREQRQHQESHGPDMLSSGMAHDLNNTLHMILGYAAMVIEDLEPSSLPWHNLQQVINAGTRARDLVQQALQASRHHAGAPRPVRLGPVIRDVLALLQASCPATVTLQQVVAPQDSPILGEATQLYRVVLNLCLNAVQAMRLQGGILAVCLETITLTDLLPVQVGTLHPGAYVRCRVRDTGAGIAPDTFAQMFEPWFTTKAAGTGMGLTIVQRIVCQHGGALHVTSRPDAGSTFTLYFPVACAPLARC